MVILLWFLPVLGIFGHRAPEPLAIGTAIENLKTASLMWKRRRLFVTANDQEEHLYSLVVENIVS